MPRNVGQLLRELPGSIQILDHQAAIFTGGFDGYVADIKHALRDGLDHPYVLYLGKLNDARGFGSESSFVAQLVSSDRQFDGLPLQMALQGP